MGKLLLISVYQRIWETKKPYFPEKKNIYNIYIYIYIENEEFISDEIKATHKHLLIILQFCKRRILIKNKVNIKISKIWQCETSLSNNKRKI